jgi:FkbM family methyltransferase
MNRIYKLLEDLLYLIGFSIRKTADLRNKESMARSASILNLIAASPLSDSLSLNEAVRLIGKSKSQLGQDIAALSQVGLVGKGYFVEFGATDGLKLSNTYMLEKSFGWSGILCEPARNWHSELRLNRSCSIDTRCVFNSSGEKVQFYETSIGELSTISAFLKSDANRLLRKKAARYEVETVTLSDLLSDHGAPAFIDFLSVDTEGSEYEILKDFDFSKYSFGLICVEHNFTENRVKLRELMTRNGYSQVFSEFSEFDDWYQGPRGPHSR